jgi:hypothetical protein
MSADRDPIRFSESASAPELQELFRSARQDLPSSSKLEGLWARIEPLAGPTSGISPSPAAPGGGTGALATGKVIAIVTALGAAFAVAYFSTRPAPVASEEPTARPPAEVQAQAPPSTAAPSPATTSTVAPEAVDAAKPAPSSTSAMRAPAEGRGAPPPSKPITDASAEAALLERAREAIATDPKRALAITREHARRFPKGILAQEREVIAIDALKRLGKGSEAESRVDQFKKTYPGSAHQHGLDSATNQR